MSGLSVPERIPEPATADLHVYLLGPPSLAWRGEPLALQRRQTRALLYHLAAIPQLVARDRLCFLFWPDATQATARCNLSRLVSILHGALPDPALLIAADDHTIISPTLHPKISSALIYAFGLDPALDEGPASAHRRAAPATTAARWPRAHWVPPGSDQTRSIERPALKL